MKYNCWNKKLKEEISKIKNKYETEINKLKNAKKELQKQEFQEEVKRLVLIEKNSHFDTFWNMFLAVYDNIYMDSNDNKYYFVKDGEIVSIDIINNFKLNIHKLTFHKVINRNVGTGNSNIYCYVYADDNSNWIYEHKNWVKL